MTALTEVPIGAGPPERFAAILGDRAAEVYAEVSRAAEALRGRVVWHINSTSRGGGVAEMLHSHLSYARGAGIDVRWLVVDGTAPFFEVTKRIHNRLHESEGDGEPLGDEARAAYTANLTAAGAAASVLISPGDIVFLHDPQTAGLAESVKALEAHVVWRCHIGVDQPGPLAREAWDFLRPYLRPAEALVFSRREFVWEGLEEARIWIVPPTIDAFSPKNQELDAPTVEAILAAGGMTDSRAPVAPVFTRGDGSPGRVDRESRRTEAGRIPAVVPLITQVSRWDRLKDPIGLLHCFADHVSDSSAHLALIGPDVEAVLDDPEGKEVLAEVVGEWEQLPDVVRERVHLVSLPMDDLEENAAMVNAIQRRSDIVVQKSLAEGFGLTVAEAMWKSRPVVAGRIGGIQDQIVDGESGLLVDDPADLAGVGRALDSLLADPEFARQMGRRAHERIAEKFLAIDRMLDYFRNLERLID